MNEVAAAALRAALEPPHRAWSAPAASAGADATTPTHRRAAVLVPIVAGETGPALVFIRRRSDLRHHGGQVAFPGGSADGGEDPLACALREFEEELGVPGARVTVLGSLPCHGSSAGFYVHPTVGLIPSSAPLRLDVGEVESTFAVPIADLRAPDRWSTRQVLGGTASVTTPTFRFADHDIWGLTARIVRDLLARWR